MKQLVYTITAYRWGDRESHSYVVGVTRKKHDALKAADVEEAHRGGRKYICEVLEWTIDVTMAGNRANGPKTIKALPKQSTLATM